jgi:RNA polymerase sigma-70 factor (ECF subfamily)
VLENQTQDITIWESFKKGDQEAFRQLFRQYYPSLFLYGQKITSDKELLEDSIQDLFAELWLSPSKTHVQSVRAYLLKALQYKLIKNIQKRSRIQLSGEDPEQTAFQVSPENLIIHRENQAENGERVKAAMVQLSRRQQEIVYLRFFQNLSYEEISEVMNINYQVARNLLYQSIKALRQHLA